MERPHIPNFTRQYSDLEARPENKKYFLMER